MGTAVGRSHDLLFYRRLQKVSATAPPDGLHRSLTPHCCPGGGGLPMTAAIKLGENTRFQPLITQISTDPEWESAVGEPWVQSKQQRAARERTAPPLTPTGRRPGTPGIAVGTAVAGGPPLRSVREELLHTAPALSRARNRSLGYGWMTRARGRCFSRRRTIRFQVQRLRTF